MIDLNTFFVHACNPFQLEEGHSALFNPSEAGEEDVRIFPPYFSKFSTAVDLFKNALSSKAPAGRRISGNVAAATTAAAAANKPSSSGKESHVEASKGGGSSRKKPGSVPGKAGHCHKVMSACLPEGHMQALVDAMAKPSVLKQKHQHQGQASPSIEEEQLEADLHQEQEDV